MYSHYQESLNILLAEKCNNSKEIILKSSGILMLEKTLESPLDSKEMKPVHPNSECSLKELMLKMKLQYFGHEMIRTDSLEKTLMLGKIEDQRGDKRLETTQRMRWLDCMADSRNMDLSKLWETVENRRTWCPTVHGVTKSWAQRRD